MKNVFVTGAGGFIGSHLVDALLMRGLDVRALVRYVSHGGVGFLDGIHPRFTNLEIVRGDVRDAGFIRESVKGCDTIFHLAALIGIPYSYAAPESYFDTNVRGAMNVLNAARESGARVVMTSTSEVYGTAQYTPIDEKHPLQAQSPYAASKIASDKLAESYGLTYGMPVVTVRPFNTYGPRQSTRAVIPTIITQLQSDSEFLELGDLTTVRDLLYVKDTVAAFIAAADGPTGTVMNFGTGAGQTIGKLATTLMHITGRTKSIKTDSIRLRPENSEVKVLLADASRAYKELSWGPIYPLCEGLAETVEYFTYSNERSLKGYAV